MESNKIQISLHISEEMRDEIAILAKNDSRSISSMMRIILAKGLDQFRPVEPQQ